MNNSEASKKLKQIIDKESIQTLEHQHFLVPAVIDSVKSGNIVVVKARPQVASKNGSKPLNIGLVEVPLMVNPSISTNVEKGDQGLLLCIDYYSEKTPKADSYEAKQRSNHLNNAWFLPLGQDPKNIQTNKKFVKLDARDGKLILKNKQGDLKKTLEDLIDLVQTCFDEAKGGWDKASPIATDGGAGLKSSAILALGASSIKMSQKVSDLKTKLGQLMDTEN